MHTSFYSYATAVQEDTLELIVKQELAAAEEKYKDELFKLDQKYDGGRWNLYDADGHYRVNITSKNSWDREYAKSAHPVDPYYPSQDEWDNLYDDLHDDDYCHDCGSRMCSGNCRQIMDDDPLDLRSLADSEADEDFKERHEGPDGCTWCGNFRSDCSCYDDDPVMSEEWVEEARLAWMDRHDAESFYKFRDVLTRRLKFLHLHAKEAADAEDSNSDSHGNSHGNVWKRSNRTVRKQWARHKVRQCKQFDDLNERAQQETMCSIDLGLALGKKIRRNKKIDMVLSRLHGRGGFSAEFFRMYELPKLMAA